MNRIERLVCNTMPAPPARRDLFGEALARLFEAAATCAACADACLADPEVAELRRCIRLNSSCGDLCSTTARVIARLGSEPGLARAQLPSCALACRLAAEECERHAATHAPCAVCAEACRACEQACERLLSSLGPAEAARH